MAHKIHIAHSCLAILYNEKTTSNIFYAIFSKTSQCSVMNLNLPISISNLSTDIEKKIENCPQIALENSSHFVALVHIDQSANETKELIKGILAKPVT